MRRLAAIFLAALLVTVAADRSGRAETVDLELVLAIDVSGSIDDHEARLQREGYLRALSDPEMVRIITSGARGRIAITYFEWAGDHHRHTVADWTVIRDAASARTFVERIAESPPTRERWTSISGAIAFAIDRFRENLHSGPRKVLDISADGPNNSGPDLAEVRARALAEGITINGLPIINDRPQPFGMPPVEDLDRYFVDHVIGGPGAFIVVARGFDNFAQAIRTKLVREISWTPGPVRYLDRAGRDVPNLYTK